MATLIDDYATYGCQLARGVLLTAAGTATAWLAARTVSDASLPAQAVLVLAVFAATVYTIGHHLLRLPVAQVVEETGHVVQRAAVFLLTVAYMFFAFCGLLPRIG